MLSATASHHEVRSLETSRVQLLPPEMLRGDLEEEENVGIVRRLYEAIAARDETTVLSLYHPDVVADFSESPEGDLMDKALIYRGHDGVRRLSRDWNESWADFPVAPIDGLIDAGEHVDRRS